MASEKRKKKKTVRAADPDDAPETNDTETDSKWTEDPDRKTVFRRTLATRKLDNTSRYHQLLLLLPQHPTDDLKLKIGETPMIPINIEHMIPIPLHRRTMKHRSLSIGDNYTINTRDIPNTLFGYNKLDVSVYGLILPFLVLFTDIKDYPEKDTTSTTKGVKHLCSVYDIPYTEKFDQLITRIERSIKFDKNMWMTDEEFNNDTFETIVSKRNASDLLRQNIFFRVVLKLRMNIHSFLYFYDKELKCGQDVILDDSSIDMFLAYVVSDTLDVKKSKVRSLPKLYKDLVFTPVVDRYGRNDKLEICLKILRAHIFIETLNKNILPTVIDSSEDMTLLAFFMICVMYISQARTEQFVNFMASIENLVDIPLIKYYNSTGSDEFSFSSGVTVSNNVFSAYSNVSSGPAKIRHSRIFEQAESKINAHRRIYEKIYRESKGFTTYIHHEDFSKTLDIDDILPVSMEFDDDDLSCRVPEEIRLCVGISKNAKSVEWNDIGYFPTYVDENTRTDRPGSNIKCYEIHDNYDLYFYFVYNDDKDKTFTGNWCVIKMGLTKVNKHSNIEFFPLEAHTFGLTPSEVQICAYNCLNMTDRNLSKYEVLINTRIAEYRSTLESIED